ncbi:MAG TPA: hypothetical protein PLM71_05305 [Syntrophorhabdaceae bacterium]|nr:hypothetical protein [Syntrophorhabdaceae bacterium]
MADFYTQGKEVNKETLEAFTRTIEEHYKNYIPFSERARKEYAYFVMKIYEEFIASQKKQCT